MTTPIDDLNPVPPQPELAEGNQVFHQKSYDLYVWMRTKLAPALEYVVSLLVNFVAGAYNASSTTSMALSLGAKTIDVQTGMGYVPGNPIRVAYTTDATKYVDGVVTNYNSTTGALNFTATFLPSGVSGTFALWSISIIPSVGGLASLAANKFSGAQDFANAVAVASASTVNLNAMASNTGTLTGSTTITAWTLSNGATRRLLCPAGVPLTYNATTNNLNTGGANYTTQAGDVLDITAYGTTIDVVISPANGGVVGGLVTATNNATFNSTSDTQPTTPSWVDGKIKALFNVTGLAPLYACRAWANYNGVTNTIRASGNVSSITDNGTGDGTANFTTAMPDANYASNITVGAGNNVMTAIISGLTLTAPTASAFRFQTLNSANAMAIDSDYVSLAIFR